MSASVFYIVRCDWSPCSEQVVDNTAWEARERAQKMGWQVGKTMRSQDRCSKHKQMAVKS